MNRLLPVSGDYYRYTRFIGTGGVGSGIVFNLDGNHTIGRNESRSGKLMPFRDYCKLHIIMHYPSVLLGRGRNGFFSYPIGNVGCDETGAALLREMEEAGMDLTCVSRLQESPTLYSVCFQYPDKSGGNITTSNSACHMLRPADIDRFMEALPAGETEIVLAAPEVPLDSRIRLLEHGRNRGSFNIGAFLSFEVAALMSENIVPLLDLLAVNIDEAQAIAGITEENASPKEIVEKCSKLLSGINPDIMLIITCGAQGSYSFYKDEIEHVPVLPMDVVSTAGAGDAFLGGTISGLCCGLPFIKGRSDVVFAETPLSSAVELGTLISNLKVTSPDTIYHALDTELLRNFCIGREFRLSGGFAQMLGLNS